MMCNFWNFDAVPLTFDPGIGTGNLLAMAHTYTKFGNDPMGGFVIERCE